MSISMCVLGGVMLDAVTHIENMDIQQLAQEEIFHFNDISWHVGGGGTNPAVAAVKLNFAPVSLIFKLGFSTPDQPDVIGERILDFLKAQGITPIFCGSTAMTTGTTLIIYMGDKTRFVVSSNKTERTFADNEITTDMLNAVEKSDIIYVSGYSLIGEVQLRTTLKLLDHAKYHQKLTVLDVLPHKIYQHFSQEDFVTYTSKIDVVLSEFNTFKRLFASSLTKEEFTYSEMASYLSNFYPSIILRTPNHEQQLTYHRGNLIETIDLDFATVDPKSRRGYFDAIGISTLSRYYPTFINHES